MTFQVRPVSGSIGAEVYGVDLSTVDDEQFKEIHDLLVRHLVLFFPEAGGLTPEAHQAFGSRFGELEVHPFLPKLEGHEHIVVLDSDKGAKADVWHTDVSYVKHPPITSVLQITLTPEAGGDTMWSNQYLAYEALSEPMRELLEGTTASHVFAHPQGTFRSEVEHPVVRVHPVSGRKSLYVNRMFTKRILQLSRGESAALLEHLFEVSESPQRTCRYRWAPGAVAMWDNRATQHYAVNDYTGRRVGQRVTVMGDDPRGAEPRWPHFQEGAMAATVVKD
ncbi:TauD/TfdA family dioxygenase [Actinosynnema pretiosum subsp. pretiosum]|nr:TauD/TfdA family dioxygenase [Actinosynnema mirum]AXX31749.1 Alpha-ketoglutarate-dependent taurine dioxygenase [Actinosynnema pretiosum subsp. pretiosum]QUF04246.1 TauD/TfdA family dioxygenase [Actinosynnema pretiosum subsp. pretiosum]